MILLFTFMSVFLAYIETEKLYMYITEKYHHYKPNHLAGVRILSIIINIVLQLKLFYNMNGDLFFNNDIYFYLLLFIVVLFVSIVASCLSILFVIDMFYYELPNELNFLIGLLFIPISLFLYSGDTIATGLIIFAIYFLLAFFTNSFGMGDAKLALVLGFVVKLTFLLKFIFISFLLASIFSIVTIIKDKKGLKSEIPFGPFIIISFLLIF